MTVIIGRFQVPNNISESAKEWLERDALNGDAVGLREFVDNYCQSDYELRVEW